MRLHFLGLVRREDEKADEEDDDNGADTGAAWNICMGSAPTGAW
eukprot:CAMPEP_0178737228 /NCGR_PEP_ID=MMETSP0744-20121128/2858_1 /TAXON_ID=913974 /ORGANISM="Nitzschia punctata, Strain CCMP561" /LENGTH=43 /DNA_ID= /DNA_START= /DNA_END= /DNA_ORIENTATION=